MTAIGAEQLATHITDLQTKLKIEQTEQGRIALVGSMVLVPSALTSICVVLPVTSALMAPLPLSYNRFATDCAKEVISAAVDEEKKRKSHDFLTKLKEDLQKVEKMGSDSSAELLNA
jgi:hypothetical protein